MKSFESTGLDDPLVGKNFDSIGLQTLRLNIVKNLLNSYILYIHNYLRSNALLQDSGHIDVKMNATEAAVDNQIKINIKSQ